MRSIAIMNQKGGVGKTTTAVNISAALADRGKRVCLIDLDPQAHASLHLGVEAQVETPTIYDVLVRNADLAEVRRQVAENLYVIPSHIDLATADVERAGILHDKLQEVPEPPDYVFVDCPPSLGILTLNALAAVEEVFIPLQPHFLAFHGLSKLLETIDVVAKRLNDRLRLSGIILCLYDTGTRLATEVSQDVDEFFHSARGQKDALGRSPDLSDPDPPQHPPGRGPQLRAIDLPVRPRLERRPRLPAIGRRDPGRCGRRRVGLG